MFQYSGGDTIDINLITGECARNKGMALFPRRINGRFAMISRIDNENLYYMESDDVLCWDQARVIQRPQFPWQVIQLGNCGSPIETEQGWLLMTHGVGPMRQYCIGASLFDRDEPWRLIGQTREPLLVPTDHERGGYVPNVVYSCGAMMHNGLLIVPYAMSDLSTSVARIDAAALLDELSRTSLKAQVRIGSLALAVALEHGPAVGRLGTVDRRTGQPQPRSESLGQSVDFRSGHFAEGVERRAPRALACAYKTQILQFFHDERGLTAWSRYRLVPVQMRRRRVLAAHPGRRRRLRGRARSRRAGSRAVRADRGHRRRFGRSGEAWRTPDSRQIREDHTHPDGCTMRTRQSSGKSGMSEQRRNFALALPAAVDDQAPVMKSM